MRTAYALLSILLLAFPALTLHAAEIVNVNPSRSNNHIMVEYDLMSDTPVMVNVTVTVQGVTYTQEQLTLEGDVRKHVHPGRLRKFMWNVKKDFPAWPDIEVTVQSSAHHLR